MEDATRSEEVQAGRNPKYFREKSINIQGEEKNSGKNPTNSGRNPKKLRKTNIWREYIGEDAARSDEVQASWKFKCAQV